MLNTVVFRPFPFPINLNPKADHLGGNFSNGLSGAFMPVTILLCQVYNSPCGENLPRTCCGVVHRSLGAGGRVGVIIRNHYRLRFTPTH